MHTRASKELSSNGSRPAASICTNEIPGWAARARSSATAEGSAPNTSAPAAASRAVMRPSPQPRSSRRGEVPASATVARAHATACSSSGRPAGTDAQISSWNGPSISEGAAVAQHRGQRLQHDREVEEDAPGLEIQKVEPDQLVEVQLGPPRHL